MSRPEFGIKHYAGEVIYEVCWNKNDQYFSCNNFLKNLFKKVKNFLDKNRDMLRLDVIEMFIGSRNQVFYFNLN